MYQRVHQVVLQNFQDKPWPVRKMIARALRAQTYYHRTRQGRSYMWDLLVFWKVKAALGGRVRLFFTGSAPLSPVLQEFIKVCFGCPMYEGYGLTESGAISNTCDLRDPNVGHVGGPMVSCEMRLESVPDMNYRTDDRPCARGEVLLRGPSIMKGYYREPGMTAEVVDGDGWFHTGDIGRFNGNGTLSIIDRKKNMFKMAQVSSCRVRSVRSGSWSRKKFENSVAVSSLTAKLLTVLTAFQTGAQRFAEVNANGLIYPEKSPPKGPLPPTDGRCFV